MNFAFIRRSLRKLSWLRPRPSPHLRLGRRGERIAERYLRRRGWVVLARRYQSPLGEVDLVALDGDQLVFAEVKARTDVRAVDSSQIVHPDQRRRIEHAARYFIASRSQTHRSWRIDLVVVDASATRDEAQVEHVEAAWVPPRGRAI